MENSREAYSHIKGWGVDADPLDAPFYPMKKRTENDNKGMIWERPAQQRKRVEVLHSNERPGLTAVYGTPNPPSGLSGSIRRYAFRYSESKIRHWLLLLLADRVNMIEGIREDLNEGHVPDIFSELGGKAEWKYNKTGLVRKVAVGAGIVLFAALWINRKKD